MLSSLSGTRGLRGNSSAGRVVPTGNLMLVCRCRYFLDQIAAELSRVRQFLVEQGADEEMLDVVDVLREENAETWLDPQIADDLRAGRLPEGEA